MLFRSVSVDAKISGIYERMLGNWAGALAELKVKTAYGPVTLEKPMRLAYVPDLNRANVSKACLAHTHARLCLENDLKIDLTNRSDLRILIGLPACRRRSRFVFCGRERSEGAVGR